MTKHLWLALATAPTCVVLTGCHEASTPESVVVRDSAGIRLIESANPLWQPQQEWQVSEQPELNIGSEDMGPCGQLQGVTDARRLSDGRIAVVNTSTHELLFYGNDGSCLAPVGGQGGGPGEFNSLGHMWVRGGSLFAFDGAPPRLVEFDRDGRFKHAVQLDINPSEGLPRVEGLFLDGSILVTHMRISGQREMSEGLHRGERTFARYDSAGKIHNQLGTYPARESDWLKYGPRVLPSIFLFGRSTAFVAHGVRFYVADNSTYEIRAYSLEGVLQTIIRRSHEPIEVAEADIDAVIDALMSSLMFPPSWENVFRGQPTPSTMPAFGWNNQGLAPTIHVDDAENVWVKEYDRPTEERHRWSVFDSEGLWLGFVNFPCALEPKHIGDDFVLGLLKDELDVEHIRLYRLSKP